MWILIIILASCVTIGAGVYIRRYFLLSVEKRASRFQRDLLATYCEEVRSIYHDMRGWRHDYRNHIQTLKAYRHNGEDGKLDSYLSMLDDDLNNVDSLIKSGNVTLDAILNAKLNLAASRKITINAKAKVPEDLKVSDTDLCIIMGNLLDNASEACLKVEDSAQWFIRVYMDVKKGHLYISVTNSSADTVAKYGKFISGKKGFHGYGLKRVDRAVARYGGYIKRAGEEGAFTTEVMIPLN